MSALWYRSRFNQVLVIERSPANFQPPALPCYSRPKGVRMDAIEQPAYRFCAECGRPTLPDELASFNGHMVCPECKNSYVQKLRLYGGFWIRFVAALMDGIILAVVAGLFSMFVFGSFLGPHFTQNRNPTPEEALAMIGPLLGVIGASMLVNMIVGCSYETFFIAASRYFAKMVSSMMLMIGYIMAGFDSQKRALHDIICDTRVIKTQD